MPKRIGNIYDEALSFSKIRNAFYRTARRKKKTADFIKFEQCLEDNIIDIYKKLKNETYEPGTYMYMSQRKGLFFRFHFMIE